MSLRDMTGGDEGIEGIEYQQSGTAQRLPLVLCLDTSSSMAGKPINDLNAALTGWANELQSDAYLKGSVDVAVVTFGADGVQAWRGNQPLPPRSHSSPFISAARFYPPVLSAGGVTLLTEALELAIRHANDYKSFLRGQNLQYYRPLVFLMTDGLPTDESGVASETWQRMVPMLRADEQQKKLQLWAIGVGHLDKRGERVLSELAPNGYRILDGFPFRAQLQALSASIGEMVRSAGQDTVQMPQAATGGPETADPLEWMFGGQRPAGG